MLPENKLRSNRRALRICAKLNLLPCRLREEGRQMDLNIPRSHRIGWLCVLTVLVIYVGYINMRLLETLARGHETGFAELGIHLSRCVMSAVMTFWAYDGFISHGGEKAIIYNYSNKQHISQENNKKKQGTSFHSFVQDQMLLNCPSMLYPVSFFFVGFFLWKNHSIQFLYAAVPAMWQGKTALVLCALFEFTVGLFWMAHAHLFVILNTTSQQKLEALLIAEQHESSSWLLSDLKRKFRIMREVQTAVTIHGIGNRRSIFAHKVICISLGIVGFFFFIRLIGVIQVVPFMFLVIGINSLCFYSVMWDNANAIPELMQSMRDEILPRLPRGRSGTKLYLQRGLKSIPPCALQVGTFSSMERNSTLIFTDFVSSNLASLLISF